MRTLVVSDLHLGSTRNGDLLRRPDLRAPLLEAIADVDRFVILGDGIELRENPQRDAAELAGDVFADFGRALGPDGELVLVGGNHDHGLVAGWIEGRLQSEPPGFLGLEQRIAPEAAGPLAARLAARAAPARVTVAYPGLWLRDDVYAIHGHYSDLHTTVPTFERLAAGAMARWVVHLPPDDASADGYEAALAPLYAWMHSLVAALRERRADRRRRRLGARLGRAGGGGAPPPPAPRAPRSAPATRVAVAALNALGLGPIDRDLSGQALRRGGLLGMHEVLAPARASARPTCCSATRTAPARGRATIPRSGRRRPARACSTAAAGATSRTSSAPSPTARPTGRAPRSALGDSGPPELIRLLGDRGHDELRPRPPRA